MSGLNSVEGLASNLDTSSIIEAQLTFERQPAVLMEKRQAEITNEITTYNSFSAKLLALQTSILALNSRTKLSQASITISDETLLTATATDVVGNGTYTLNILSLARNHQIASQGFDDPTQAVMGTGTITLALGNQSSTTITVSEGSNSLVDIKNAINNSGAGITASIVNDGSDSKPYRLVLTGSKTGRENQITVTSSLTDGLNLDFTTSTFDNPEALNFSSQTTATVSLGATANYTGSTNKNYIFTVAGSGAQTVGDGNITINWVDAEDSSQSGSIVIDQADKIIEGGPAGLTLTFSDGNFVAGDSFQVTAFAPLLQQASDAKISIGSSDGGASPIVIYSADNTFEDVIPGVELEVARVTTSDTGPVTIETGLNTEGIKTTIQSFITAYNAVMTFIDEQNTYDSDTEEAGTLMGDLTLMTIQSRLQGMISGKVKGLESSTNSLAAIGIRTGSTGRLSIVDSSRLTAALEGDFESVVKLFIDSGASSSNGISFVSATSNVKTGTAFEVDITRAASHGFLEGTSLTDFADEGLTLTSTKNKIRLRVDGVVSDDIVLSNRTYTSSSDLVNELQTRINADEKIGARGVTVTWVDEGEGKGHLEIYSGAYGSTSKVETIGSVGQNAYSLLGLAAATVNVGHNVEGTINGEKATGQGQILTGNKGNTTTAGLSLKVTLDRLEVGEGIEGTITYSKGFSSILGNSLESMTKSEDGLLARRTAGLQNEVEEIERQVEDFDERLALRREDLEKKWADLETLLSELQSESSYLEAQLAALTSSTTGGSE